MSAMSMMFYIGANTVGLNKAASDIYKFRRGIMASNVAINQSLTETNNKLKDTNAAIINFGRTLTMFVSAPLGLVAASSTKTFANFEYDLAKITGLVGIASEQTKEWGDEILRMAPKIGKAPQELADALYFITSSGFKTSESMNILNASAKAAASGLGETKNVADIVTSAMNAYQRGTLSASKAVDILTMAVREGKGEPEELVKAFATSIPIAAKLGVEFDEVGGALASMTRLGINASTASTYLRQSLFTLLKPSTKTVKGLQAIGLSANNVRDSLRNNGLIDTFTMLSEKTKNLNQEALSNIFPNIRAFMALVSLVNDNLEETKNVFDTVTNSAGVTDFAFAAVSETLKFKWNQAMAQGRVLLIKIGETVGKSLLPLLERLTSAFKDLGKFWDSLGPQLQDTIIKFAGLAIVMGPMILLWKGIKSVFSGVGIVFDAMSEKLFKLTSAIKTFTIYSNNAAQAAQKVSQNVGSVIAGGTVGAGATGGAKRTYVTKEQDAASFSMAARAAAYKKQTDIEIQKAQEAAKTAKATAKQQIAAGEAVKKARESTVMGTKVAAFETKKLTDLTLAATIAQQNASNADVRATSETLRLAKYKAYLSKAQELTIAQEEKAIATRGLSNNLYSRAAKLKAELAQEELAYAAAKSKSNLSDALGLRSTTSLTGAYTVQGKVMGPQAKMYELRKKLKQANAAATSIEIAAIEAEKKAQEGRIFISQLENRVTTQSGVVTEVSTRARKKHQVALLLEAEAAKRKAAIEMAETRAIEARNAAYIKASAANKIYMASTGNTYKSIRAAHLANLGLQVKQAKQVRDNAKAAEEAAKTAANTANNVNKARFSWAALFTSLGKIPWMVVVAALGGIAYALYKVTKASETLYNVNEKQKKAIEELNESFANEKSKVDLLLSLAKNELLSRKMRLDAIAKLNEISPEYLGNINLENIGLQNTTKAIEEYNKGLQEQIQNQVYADQIQVLLAEHNKNIISGKINEISVLKKATIAWKELNEQQQHRIVLANLFPTLFAPVGKGSKIFDFMNNLKAGEENILKAQKEREEENNAVFQITLAKFSKGMNQKQYAVNDLIASYNSLKDAIIAVTKEDEKVTALEKSAKTKEQISAAAKARKEQQEHVKNAITRMNTQIGKAKELLEYSQKMVDNDELLKVYADQMLSTNEKIRIEAAKLYQERLNELLNEGKIFDQNKGKVESIYKAYENGYGRLRKMYKGENLPWEDEENVTTPDSPEVTNKINEIWAAYEEGLRSSQQLKLFGKDFITNIDTAEAGLDTIKNTFIELSKLSELDFKKVIGSDAVNQMKEFYKQLTLVKTVEDDLNKTSNTFWESVEKSMDAVKNYSNVLGSTFTETLENLNNDMELLVLQSSNLGKYFDKTGEEMNVLKKYIDALHDPLRILTQDEKNLLDVLEKLHAKLAATKSIENSQAKLDSLRETINALEDDMEFADQKADLLRQSMRILMKMKPGNKEGLGAWIEQVRTLGVELGKTMLKAELFNMLVNAITDIFTGLGEAVGSAMAGVKDSMSLFVDVILNVVKQVAKILIGIGSVLLVLTKGAIGWSWVVGGTALTALATTASTAYTRKNNKESSAQSYTKLAQGGIIPPGYPNDSYPARLSSGEMVIPPMKLPEFEKQAIDVHVTVEGKTRGQDLYYVIKEVERRYKNAH